MVWSVGADVGADVAGDVDECAEHVRMHDGQVTAQVPPIDQPAMPQLARSALTPKLRDHERHDVLRQVIGGVTAARR